MAWMLLWFALRAASNDDFGYSCKQQSDIHIIVSVHCANYVLMLCDLARLHKAASLMEWIHSPT
jgi:hypothetical protein